MAISHVKSNIVPDWTGTVTIGNSTGGTQTVAATDLVRPVDWNSAHNQYYTLSGNTNGASTASGTNVVLSGGNNVTLVGGGATVGFSVGNYITTGALSDHSHGNPTLALTNLSGTTASNSAGLTLSLSAAAPGGGAVGSFYQHPPLINNTNTMSVGGGSSNYVQPFVLPYGVSASYIRMPVSMSLASTTFTTGAAGYGASVAQSNTLWFNIYTRGGGASSLSLQYLTQASATWAFQISYSGTASTHTVSYNVTFPTLGGTSSTQMTSSQQSSAVNQVPAGTSNFQSFRYFDIPFATSLSAGNYYMALQRSSTTGGGSNIGLGISAMIVTQHNSSIGVPNQASNSSNHLVPYLGSWSTNSLGATTSSIGKASISTLGSHPVAVFQIIREA